MDWENYTKQVNASLKRMAAENVNDANFGILYDLTANHLLIVARKYLIDKSLDEEAVTDAYMNAIKGIGGFDEEKNGYNWLCKITKRVALDYNERTRKDAERNCALSSADILLDSHEEDFDAKMDLEKALDTLDETGREMVYLYYFEGYKYSEIGEKFGIKKSAVKRRVDRNVKKLEDFLKTM